MNTQPFSPLDDVIAALRDSYFAMQAPVESLPEVLDEDRRLLGQVMLLVWEQRPTASWSPKVTTDFVRLVCRGIENSLYSGIVGDHSQCIQILCALAIQASGIELDAQIYPWRIWTLNKLAMAPSETLQAILAQSLEDLQPYYTQVALGTDRIANILKAQAIVGKLRLSPDGEYSQLSEVARAWCAELLQDDLASPLLASAGIFAQADPKVAPQPEIDSGTVLAANRQVNVAKEDGPEFWVLPTIMEDLEQESEWKSALFELQALSFMEPCPLMPRTREQVRSLKPHTERADLSRIFFFSVGELWQCFVRAGNRDALRVSKRLGLLILTYEASRGWNDKERYFSNAATLWIRLQLPFLIKTCNIDSVITDSHRLCEKLNWRQRDQVIRQALVEAFAGECRALEVEGDRSAVDTLVGDSFESLKKVHQSYLDKCRANSKPPSSEEALAWDYLATTVNSKFLLNEQSGSQGGTGSMNMLPSTGSILENQTFVHIIRTGAHQAAYELVTERCDEIRGLLMRRLDVKLLPEHLMSPEGRVYNPNASARGQVDSAFLEAEESIRQGIFSRAYALLERLANTLQGRPREFCRSWQAYALARNGDLLLARQCLQDLTASRFPYPSAYWNLACCLPPEQMERQLDVLAMGVELAPHPSILHGAIFLASLMNDARLANWLLYLTFPEALLLAFQLRFEDMSPEDRDKSLLRLNHYLKHGEPIAPDPTDPRVNFQVAANYINDLIQREQIRAAEFWLRCRESISQRHFEFWQLKSALLHQTGRRMEAARAFQKELQCRLEALGKGRFLKANSPADITQRASEWLRHCMAPELRDIGNDIFTLLAEFSNRNNRNVMPRDRRLLEFYDRRPVDPTRGSLPKPPSPQPTPPPTVSRDRLLSVIASAGSECSRELHEVEHLPRVELTLRRLMSELEVLGLTASFESIKRLVSSWRDYTNKTTKEQRQLSYRTSKACLTDLQNHFGKELTPEEGVTAHLLLQAFNRVNERLARSLNLLPEIIIESPVGGGVKLGPDRGGDRSFAVRVRCNPDAEAVKITGCSAALVESLVELPLRDELDEVDTCISPSQSALLSFAVPVSVTLGQGSEVQIIVRYEYAGETFTAPPHIITLEIVDAQSVAGSHSPFIFGRALELNEIEAHFFGREKEKETLISSVSDGQQRLIYIEGIRRSGKTSLLRSVQYEVIRQGLPLLAIYASAAAVSKNDSAGKVFFNLARQICLALEDSGVIVSPPGETSCIANLVGAYDEFNRNLASMLGERRVVVFLDDFQALIEQASLPEANLAADLGTLFNLIRQYAGPNSKLLWIFAGHRAQRQFRNLLPGILLWADLRPLRIDFLGLESLSELIKKPLDVLGFTVPEETLARIQLHTEGHPEVSQQMGEFMFTRAMEEGRTLITPSDADEAAKEIATSTDSFADTWYPIAELTGDQRSLIGAFINAVKPGGKIAPGRIVVGQQLSESVRQAIDDLVARKILTFDGIEVRIKARVLDLWLHRTVPMMITERVNGSIAIFVDIANLTSGNGSTVLNNLDTAIGEHGIPGQFDLDTVLDAVEREAHQLTPAPVAAKWVINYPRRCPAVVVCSSKGFYVENIPEGLREKGSDDIILASKMWEVEDQYPTVNHFLLVLGDKDYKEAAIDRLLKNGKYVHLVSRKAALANRYNYLADAYPQRFTVKTLESLLTD